MKHVRQRSIFVPGCFSLSPAAIPSKFTLKLCAAVENRKKNHSLITTHQTINVEQKNATNLI